MCVCVYVYIQNIYVILSICICGLVHEGRDKVGSRVAKVES